MIISICHTGKKLSFSVRNRLTQTLEVSLSTETTLPASGCFATNSMHFLFQANPVCIVHFYTSLYFKKIGYITYYFCTKVGLSSTRASLRHVSGDCIFS